MAGTGKSGIAAAELLKKQGFAVRLYDGNTELDIQSFYEKNPNLQNIEILLGDLSEEDQKAVDILVLSPGIPVDLPMVNTMRDLGAAIWGEIELAYADRKSVV